VTERSEGTDLDVRSAPAPLLTRPVVLALVISFGSFVTFYLLMPVVPLYLATGGAGDAGAGSATAVMMLFTVLAELVMPALLARYGYRLVMVLGPLLLGGGSALLSASPALVSVLAACAARGAGLAVVVVAFPALIAELVPDSRRGEALGVYGVAVGIPAMAALPLGVWLSLRVGFEPVMLAGATPALLMLVLVPGLPVRRCAAGERVRVLEGLRGLGLARPALVFAALALAAGVLLTFLPIAVPARTRGVAAVALLVHACAMPAARWAAGRYGDRHGSAGLFVPSVLVAAIGVAGLVWLSEPYAVVVGAALFGAGFGAAQNVYLALMFERAPRPAFGRVSALWNLAYDGGMGLGAVGFGIVAGPAGYAGGFALTAALVAAVLLPAWLEQSGEHQRP
jgi:MFS family permease